MGLTYLFCVATIYPNTHTSTYARTHEHTHLTTAGHAYILHPLMHVSSSSYLLAARELAQACIDLRQHKCSGFEKQTENVKSDLCLVLEKKITTSF